MDGVDDRVDGVVNGSIVAVVVVVAVVAWCRCGDCLCLSVAIAMWLGRARVVFVWM